MHTPRPPPQAFLLYLLLITTISSFSFKELKVTANSYTTNIITTYTIVYDRTVANNFTSTNYNLYPLNTTSTVTLTFPSQYTPTSSMACSYQINSTGSFTTTNCNLAGSTITLNGLFSNNSIIAGIHKLI